MLKKAGLFLLIAALTIHPPMVGYGARILPEVTNAYTEYNPEKGFEWLKDDAEIRSIVSEAQSKGQEIDSIYDLAKSISVIHTGKDFGYINGYRIDMDTEISVNAENIDGTLYATLRFVGLILGYKTDYNIQTNTVTLAGDKTIQLSLQENTMTVDGKVLLIGSPVIKNNEIIMLPVRYVCEAAGKNVLYDESGTVVITNLGKNITDEQMGRISSPGFFLEREKIVHPLNGLVYMLTSEQRSYLNKTDTAINAEISSYLEMSYYDLAMYVDTQAYMSNGRVRHMGARANFEKAAALMAVKYRRHPDEDLALRIIIMCLHSALRFDDLDKNPSSSDSFQNYEYVTPVYLVYAYEQIYHSPMWNLVNNGYGYNVRAVIKKCWKTIFDYLVINKADKPVGNYPIYVMHMAALAVSFDDSDMVRSAIKMLNEADASHSYYADGMWYEGSFSYGSSMAGNVSSAVKFIDAFRDRRCYTDNLYGIKLDGIFDAKKEWDNHFADVYALSAKAVYPDGSPIAVGDTHWQNVNTNLSSNTIKEKNLASNLELNHFGLYGLKYGNTEEAQQINLSVTPAINVSHQHDDHLAISYYSAGMELLPDVGYVPTSDDTRYTKTSPLGHNSAWTSERGLTNWASGSYFARPAVYAYDDGACSDKKIQLVEGSTLMPESYGVDINRRLLLMVAVDENHSYAVDVQRLKGAGVPESYLMQTEEEEVVLETDLNLSEQSDGKLTDWLKELGKKGGLTLNAGDYYTKYFTKPQGIVTSDDFWFSWKGKITGTTLKAFVKGNDNMTVAFSKWKASRRNDGSKGYHLLRRCDDTDGVTTFGAVYEGIAKDMQGKVLSVDWKNSPDGDDMTTMLCVELPEYIDYIYVSNDEKPREFNGYSFSGSVCHLRTNKSDGSVIHGYIYGSGSIKGKGYSLTGKENFSADVITASGGRPDDAVKNEIALDKAAPIVLQGVWGNVSFPDGSGVALKVTATDSNRILTNNDPGFKAENGQILFTSFPMYEDAETKNIAPFGSPYSEGMSQRKLTGKAVFTVKQPTFKQN